MDGSGDIAEADAVAVPVVPGVRKGCGKGRPNGKAKARPRIDKSWMMCAPARASVRRVANDLVCR